VSSPDTHEKIFGTGLRARNPRVCCDRQVSCLALNTALRNRLPHKYV